MNQVVYGLLSGTDPTLTPVTILLVGIVAGFCFGVGLIFLWAWWGDD